MDELVSVLMSTYNETEEELSYSIKSVLFQSHYKIEFIIVNDNPNNGVIDKVLDEIRDDRIIYLKNDKNIGLVASLNKALKYAKGSYIARMDADDISDKDRIKKQLKYIQKSRYDLIGCAINYIDESGEPIGKKAIFPEDNEQIIKLNKWKTCMAHPTFFARRVVFDTLSGYRNIAFCEDYDFICRCIASGFKLGNTSEVLLKYRIRNNSITQKNIIEQKVRNYYIGHLGSKILTTSEEDIFNYLSSKEYEKEIELCQSYFQGKKEIKSKNPKLLLVGMKKICNKYLLYSIIRKFI